MTKIKNLDLTSAEYQAKIVGHLESADFFDIKAFPTASVLLTTIKVKKPGSHFYTAEGTLTIKGQSHPISVDNITIYECMGKKVATGSLQFDRVAYKVNYNSQKGWYDQLKNAEKALKEKVIDDLIIVEFKVTV
jgi:polyisoprenoid-binding protein YceI